jgi:hypothetical protein
MIARQLGQKGEMRRGIVIGGRNAHQPFQRQVQLARMSISVRLSAGITPAFCGSSPY